MQYPLIALTGKARCGKDTAAALIVAKIGGYKYSFADPLRMMMAVGLGIDMADPYWLSRKEEVIPAIGKSPRQLMQTLGTEWGRMSVHPDIWVLRANQRLLSSGRGMVIADVRFENEADWVRNMDGLLIHMERPGIAPVNAHSSEDGVARMDRDKVLVNDGTIEDLRYKIEHMLDVQQT